MAKIIKATGPSPAQCMIVAERPGREEQSRGWVLCGPSGKELDRYLLTESSIDRANVRCCNLVRDYRDGANPEAWEVDRDWPLLVDEMTHVRPQYVLAMGAWSARALLGNDIEMEWANGLHFPLKTWAWPFTVMPVIHCAAGLHQPSTQVKIAHGFRQFGALIHGHTLPSGHLRAPAPVHYSTDTITITDTVAMDTEGTVESPWGLSYSVRAGQASVQHGRRHRNWNCKAVREATVVMHGAMHDLPVLKRLGVRPTRWECTLLKAALLGVEPHGLKPLARRHLGYLMTDYDTVIAPARRDKALQYLSRVVEWAEDTVTV